MTPPEMLDEPGSTLPTGPPWSDRETADANLRTELVHRHLLARLSVAEEQLQILEDQSPAPEALVARFGATITEAQRVLDGERAEVAGRAEGRRRASEARAAELVTRAEAEAAAIREVVAQLRSPALPTGPGDVAAPALTSGGSPASTAR
jgi:hypothetical protein